MRGAAEGPEMELLGPQVAITVMHLGRWHIQGDAILILMALQCILLWLRLQFYLKCASSSRMLSPSRDTQGAVSGCHSYAVCCGVLH